MKRIPWSLLLLRVPLALAGGAIVALTAAVLVPAALGAKPMSVLSGSMSPAIDTGDLVIVKPVSPTDVEVGEVVTFNDPKQDRLITHRVKAIRDEGRRFSFVTRGDANNSGERWGIAAAGEMGRVAFRIPKAGFASKLASGTAGRLGLVVVPALILLVWGLVGVWRKPSPAGPTPAPAREQTA